MNFLSTALFMYLWFLQGMNFGRDLFGDTEICSTVQFDLRSIICMQNLPNIIIIYEVSLCLLLENITDNNMGLYLLRLHSMGNFKIRC